MSGIFHQIVRYDYAQKVVNSMRTLDKHSILEVGAGAHGNLAKYLPNDDITFLDLELPNEVLSDKRFVIGDATNLEYEDNTFDFIIALDVLEHVSVNKRFDFIKNINRVAKKGVILSVPFVSDNGSDVDGIIKAFYQLNRLQPPVWVDEHIDCTLPTETDLKDLISKQGIEKENVCVFYGIKRSLMAKMLIMESIASAHPQFTEFFKIVNDDYVKRILEQDVFLDEAEAVKLYAVWSKEITFVNLKEELSKKYVFRQAAITEFEEHYTNLLQAALPLLQNLECTEVVKIEAEKVLAQNLECTEAVKIGTDKVLLKNLECTEIMKSEVAKILLQNLNNVEEIKTEIKKALLPSEKPRLNVILITYNHSAFIRDTLKTILEQRTTFNFNIIVADDCSTDDTVDIIREIEKTTTIPFIYLSNEKNLGIMQNYKRAFANCEADYIAVMEGDDLWTDSLRLQKHVEFLDAHSECAMTFNRFVVKNFEEGTTQTRPILSGAEELQYFKYISGHDLAYDNLIGNFSTCVYRRSVLNSLPEQLYDIKCYDWLTNIMVSRMGFIGCLVQPMSIYRIHSKGVWSGQSQKEQINSMIEAIETYDKYTNFEFTAGFSAHKERLKLILAAQETPVDLSGVKISKIKEVLRKVCRLGNYLPPVFTYLIKLIIPNAILDKIRRIL